MRNTNTDMPQSSILARSAADFLQAQLTRPLLLAIDEALSVGAQRAWAAARNMAKGHLPTALGQLRHLHMNETYQQALVTSGASPSPLRGNAVVTGHSGVLTLARFNVRGGKWQHGRRSVTRRQLAQANAAVESLVQPALFDVGAAPANVVVFFIADFAYSVATAPERPVAVHIALPDHAMRWWLFSEPLNTFIARYDQPVVTTQEDLVRPTLKRRREQPPYNQSTGSSS